MALSAKTSGFEMPHGPFHSFLCIHMTDRITRMNTAIYKALMEFIRLYWPHADSWRVVYRFHPVCQL